MKKKTIGTVALIFSMLCLANGGTINAHGEAEALNTNEIVESNEVSEDVIDGLEQDVSLSTDSVLNEREIFLYDENGEYTVSYKVNYAEETIPVKIELAAGVSFFCIRFSLDEVYQADLASDGTLLLDDSLLSENFLIASSVSEDGKYICITGATGDVTSDARNSIQFNLTNAGKRNSSVNVPLSLSPIEQNLICANNSVAIYGDVDGDGYVNAADAARIMYAYSNLNNGKAILTKHLLRNYQKKQYFFPSALSALCADCVQANEDGKINVVTLADAQEILTSSAYAGTGSYYDSRVGENVGSLIDYSNVVPSSVTTVYECLLPVPHEDNVIINGHGTCWLATIVSKYNYTNRNVSGFTNISVNQAFNQLESYYGDIPGGTTAWIQRANSYYNIWPHYVTHAGDFVDVYGQLNYDNPMFMGTSNHAVVLCGIKIKSDGTGEYKIMDSNYSNYVTITLNKSQMEANSDVMVAGKKWLNYYY